MYVFYNKVFHKCHPYKMALDLYIAIFYKVTPDLLSESENSYNLSLTYLIVWSHTHIFQY